MLLRDQVFLAQTVCNFALRHLWERGTRWTTNVLEVSTLSAADAFLGLTRAPARLQASANSATLSRCVANEIVLFVTAVCRNDKPKCTITATTHVTTTTPQHTNARLCSHCTLDMRTHPWVPLDTHSGRVLFGGGCGWETDKMSTTVHDNVRSQTRRPQHRRPQRMEHTLYPHLYWSCIGGLTYFRSLDELHVCREQLPSHFLPPPLVGCTDAQRKCFQHVSQRAQMTVSAKQAQKTDRAVDVVGVRQRHDPTIQIIPVTVLAPQEQSTDGVVDTPVVQQRISSHSVHCSQEEQ